MQYRKYGKTGLKVSLLGMGCMRLPRKVDGEGKVGVDLEKAFEILRYAADNGVTYFDTAYSYHNTMSENVLGEALEGGRREKVVIATKQPFGVMKTQADIRTNLENTLKKLRTSYIDVYLIHNISIGQWPEIKARKVIEEYEKFKAEGLIRNIAFSYHGNYAGFKEVLDYYDWDMCQGQQNILDVDNEVTEQGILDAGKKGCAFVVMEPLRGGGLANAPARVAGIYDEYPVKRTPAQWAFRHVANYGAVSTILSGMTTLEQLKQNIETFSAADMVPNCLSDTEKDIIVRARAAYKAIVTVPCTSCEYCLPCPQGVRIPEVFSKYNEGMMFGSFDQPQRSYMFTVNGKRDASLCVECGACEPQCPQKIEIIKQLKVAHESLKGWVE